MAEGKNIDNPIVVPQDKWYDRLQRLINKKQRTQPIGGEGWIIVNEEVLIVYQFDNPPAWIKPLIDLSVADENGMLPPGMHVSLSYDGTPEEVPA
jgi:hypothetical protein